MTNFHKTIPKSIRFTEEELQRIEKAMVEKIQLEGKTYTFSQFVVSAVFKEVKKLEKAEVKNMRHMKQVMNYFGRDISSHKKDIEVRLEELYPDAIINVDSDKVTFELLTDKNRNTISLNVGSEVQKITQQEC
jgi:hypothetical protein